MFATIFQRGSQAEFTQPITSSFELFQQARMWRWMAYIALGGALNSLGLGEMDVAYRWGAEGEQIFARLGQQKEATECSGLRAAAAPDHLFDGEVSRHLNTYGDFLLETRTFFPTVITVSLLLLYYLRQHEIEHALTLHTVLQSVPFYANSQWFQNVFGQPVISAANALSLEASPAAGQRSRQQEFWKMAVDVLKSSLESSRA